MASGIHSSCNRPKQPKHLRRGTEKKFRSDDVEARVKYRAKMAIRAARKMKKRR
jgi:hypothetical protein